METRAVTWAKVREDHQGGLGAEGQIQIQVLTPMFVCRNHKGCGARQQGDRPQADREGMRCQSSLGTADGG